MKTENCVTFTCGHSSEVKPNLFGRGQARARRLAEYSNRLCYRCSIEAVPQYVCTFNRTISEKYTLETGKEKIEEMIRKLGIKYLATYNN